MINEICPAVLALMKAKIRDKLTCWQRVCLALSKFFELLLILQRLLKPVQYSSDEVLSLPLEDCFVR